MSIQSARPSRFVSYLISGVFIEIFLDENFSHGEAHVIIHVVGTNNRAWPFGTRTTKDSIESIANIPEISWHYARSIHHETPDEVVLNGSWRSSTEKFGGTAKKGYLTDGDNIVVLQSDIRQGINFAQILREIELKSTKRIHSATCDCFQVLTEVVKIRVRLPTVVRTVSFCRALCSAAVQWN